MNRLCGEEPFKYDNDEELYKKIIKGLYDESSPNYDKISLNGKVGQIKFLNFF